MDINLSMSRPGISLPRSSVWTQSFYFGSLILEKYYNVCSFNSTLIFNAVTFVQMHLLFCYMVRRRIPIKNKTNWNLMSNIYMNNRMFYFQRTYINHLALVETLQNLTLYSCGTTNEGLKFIPTITVFHE